MLTLKAKLILVDWADTRGDSKSETKFPGLADCHPSEVEVGSPFLDVNLRTFHGVGDEEAEITQ